MRVSVYIGMAIAMLPLVTHAVGLSNNRPGLYLDNPGAVAPRQIKQSSDDPVTLEADEVGYDQKRAIVVARGHVQLLQSATVLIADQLTFYQSRDVVVAEGNVSILQPSGDVFFADKMVLQERLKHGAVETLKIRMADNSVFVAASGERVNAAVTKLTDASYTPCSLCKYSNPFWQINADKIKIDALENTISYKNATLDFFGLPVAYTPFFEHPTSGAPAQNGIMNPSYGNQGNLGTIVKVPYYWRISEDKDIKVTPWFISGLGPLLELDYQQLTDHGSYRFRGSGTNPPQLDSNGNEISGNDFRGHVFAEGVEQISNFSRIGIKAERATDDTYLRRYGFGDQQALFSRAYYEAAENRNFAQVQALAIQGLRLTDDPKAAPLILPSLQGYYETEPLDSGLRFHVSGDAQSLTREKGVNQQRLSLVSGATLPYITDNGQIITTTLNIRQDIYHTSDILIDNGTRNFSGETYRTLPQAALEWRYPLITQLDDSSLSLEPIVLFVGQTSGGNPDTISNEDNRLVELTDTNLFSLERQPGIDLVDSGSRVAYGLRSQYFFADGNTIDALFGQDYNLSSTPFPNSVTQGENFSDYIGRVAYNFTPFVVSYRFALGQKNLSFNRHEAGLDYSKKGYSLNLAYRSLDNNRYLSNSREGVLNALVPFSDSWSIYGGARRDFFLDRMITARGGIIYKNECFTLMFDAIRNYTTDRDVQPNTAYTLTIGFKNLGEFGGN